MVTDIYEKVFIAWGGNQSLAKLIGEKIDGSNGFSAMAGGGQQVDLYVGTQIFSQIKMCTRAIILVEDTEETKRVGSRINLNDNLMFEWGYIMGRLAPSKIHVFLIDLSVRDLPSDLAGSWANEIARGEKNEEAVAAEIADVFAKNATNNIESDSMDIMHNWDETKDILENYNSSTQISDMELAFYLLHSIDVCYFYMEEELLEKLLDKLLPRSIVLDFAVQLVKGTLKLFKETNYLQDSLDFDSFVELKSIFERKLDLPFQDEKFSLWVNYFSQSRLGLVYRSLEKSNEVSEEEKILFLQRSLGFVEASEVILNELKTKFPAEKNAIEMYMGNIRHDYYKLYSLLGETDKKEAVIPKVVRSKETFYLDYERKYPLDTYLIRQLAQEYYLSLAENLEFIKEPTDLIGTKRAISAFLQKVNTETEQQDVALKSLYRLMEDKK